MYASNILFCEFHMVMVNDIFIGADGVLAKWQLYIMSKEAKVIRKCLPRLSLL